MDDFGRDIIARVVELDGSNVTVQLPGGTLTGTITHVNDSSQLYGGGRLSFVLTDAEALEWLIPVNAVSAIAAIGQG
ncbi:hypothetical protein [Streptomyces sp. NBC_01285]|uniref:hypothetical protein n=1 Tax=Streptomyces sp. NBC_01285 TaxID=2903813 RepID=UPI0022556D89|nr:hypothetical protein [Streptomyces sp. NBC_01285]MCX4774023.1 hypothetical protein [Streptomyces sp. NBC_01285]